MTPHTLVTVRIARPVDLAALTGLAVALRDHLGQTTPSPDQLRGSLARPLADPSTAFVLAEAGGAALGYTQCRHRYSAWTGAPDVEREDVFVATRRRGAGRQIVEFALVEARRRGCRLACLATNARNLPALALDEGLGFSPARARWHGGRQLRLERLEVP